MPRSERGPLPEGSLGGSVTARSVSAAGDILAAVTAATETLPVTAAVPTIGRVELLEECVRTILACDPAPAEILLVDQSGGTEVQAAMRALAPASGSPAVRVVSSPVRGIALAMNTCLKEAAHDRVLITNDDCTVAPDWVAHAWRHLEARPDGIVTGPRAARRRGGVGALAARRAAAARLHRRAALRRAVRGQHGRRPPARARERRLRRAAHVRDLGLRQRLRLPLAARAAPDGLRAADDGLAPRLAQRRAAREALGRVRARPGRRVRQAHPRGRPLDPQAGRDRHAGRGEGGAQGARQAPAAPRGRAPRRPVLPAGRAVPGLARVAPDRLPRRAAAPGSHGRAPRPRRGS